MKFTQFATLFTLLTDLEVAITVRNLYDGFQILGNGWDVICHSGSFGYKDGLLEVMINGEISGYLTAQEAYELIAVVEGL